MPTVFVDYLKLLYGKETVVNNIRQDCTWIQDANRALVPCLRVVPVIPCQESSADDLHFEDLCATRMSDDVWSA